MEQIPDRVLLAARVNVQSGGRRPGGPFHVARDLFPTMSDAAHRILQRDYVSEVTP